MEMHKGFTLIELLVVIAIIALLMALLLPSLHLARKQASGSACLGNEKSLIVAWVMYADDNDGKLVGGYPYVRDIHTAGSPYPDRTQWLLAPLAEDGTIFPAAAGNSAAYTQACQATPPTTEHIERGIRAGALYPYLNTIKVYHCPADSRRLQAAPFNVYQSYSVSDPMNGKFENNQYAFKKIATITMPGSKYVFVEEAARNASFNIGSWWFGYKWSNGQIEESAFIDPVALWHGDKNTFAFADGHAEIHKWKHPATLQALRQYLDGQPFSLGTNSSLPAARAHSNEDIMWLAQHYY
jgi:prepilin-type N-terminal cleavage/methylation domain-containing protein/prepilin-type processing-associated H-X9-DG protein